jgi:hypothetical protein
MKIILIILGFFFIMTFADICTEVAERNEEDYTASAGE